MDMAAEWKELIAQRERFATELRDLEVRCNNLALEPDMHALLQKKDNLRKQEIALQKKLSGYGPKLQTRESKHAENLKQQLKASENKLKKLCANREHPVVIKDQCKEVRRLENCVREANLVVKNQNALTEHERALLQKGFAKRPVKNG